MSSAAMTQAMATPKAQRHRVFRSSSASSRKMERGPSGRARGRGAQLAAVAVLVAELLVVAVAVREAAVVAVPALVAELLVVAVVVVLEAAVPSSPRWWSR
jgi:hypothetical protein